MNKAFIFDLDGVLINDEHIWEDKKQSLYRDVFGDKIEKALGSTLGVNMDAIYERARVAGTDVDKESFINAFYVAADTIYQTAPITEGIEELFHALHERDYRIGIVSASPLPWITTVTKRLKHEDGIELIISLHERDDLSHKPHPDGYIEAMRLLESSAENTIILEDSNSGIASAKASGGYTIALRQNITHGYIQRGADMYADTIADVIDYIERT